MLRSKRFWGLLISVVFLWLALRKVEWDKLPPILSTIDPWFVAAMVVSTLTEMVWRGWRWQLILAGRGIPFGMAYSGLILGYFFNNVLPARAGEFIRAGYLGRKGLVRSSEAFGSVVLERFVDGIVVITLILAAIRLFPVSPAIRQAGFSAMTFYGIVLAGILLLQFRRDWFTRITRFFLGFLPERFRERALSAQDAFIRGLDLVRQPARFLEVVVLSFAAWSNSLLTYYLSFRVFHLPFGLDAAVLLVAVLSLGAMIPSSPGMIGIFEWCCMVVLADMLGSSRELAASYGLFTHFLTYMVVLIIGMVILTRENLSMRELQEQSVTDTP